MGPIPGGPPPNMMAQQQQQQPPPMGGGQAKKRPRKGSRVDDGNDYDSTMESIAQQLKSFPPVQTLEPKLGHYYNACPILGGGDVPKFGLETDPVLGELERDDNSSRLRLPKQGDFYNVVPYGCDPPVPDIYRMSINTRGFYKQEFDLSKERKLLQQQGSLNDVSASSSLAGSPPATPDFQYSSSPEPDMPARKLREGTEDPWNDLLAEESDEDDEPGKPAPTANGNGEVKAEAGAEAEAEKEKEKEKPKELPKFIERPKSPDGDNVVKPMPVKSKPKPLPSIPSLFANIKKEPGTEVDRQGKPYFYTIKTVGNDSNGGANGLSKNYNKAINGLTKVLKMDRGEWVAKDKREDENKASGATPAATSTSPTSKAPKMSWLNVLATDSRLCMGCDKVLLSRNPCVKKRTSELPFLTKKEKEECDEAHFCDTACYFQFAVSRVGKAGVTPTSLEQLAELQNKKKKEDKEKQDQEESKVKKEEGMGNGTAEEEEDPKTIGFRFWTPNTPSQRGTKHKKLNENDLTLMMYQIGLTMQPDRENTDDQRECLFCHMRGDRAADGPGRLLNYDVDKWVHLNCALWSEDVYETVSGALVNVETALKNGVNLICKMCEKNGATVKCWKIRCTNYYHVGCATKDKAAFYKNKSVYCHQHVPKGEKDQELTTLAVYRRVYIERDENKQVAKVMTHGGPEDQQVMRIGSLTFLSVGQLLPHQLHNFHTKDHIFPIGYKVVRYFWSTTEVNKRCAYVCTIADVDGKPEFRITTGEGTANERTYSDASPKSVWQQVLEQIAELRRKHDLVRIFPHHISGEDLFGLNETNVLKVLESLPGIESLTDYTFKYGRNPLLELPLAVNPTGCARSEPKMRTHVKRVHNFQRTSGGSKGGGGSGSSSTNPYARLAKENVPTLIGLETTGPYSKNFVQSKSSQYRKMKTEWRQNVVLARSKIQGLGLYAARDLERHQMIIEYIGEVIRSDLTDIREKRCANKFNDF